MTMLSRVLGLVRDHFQATFFGTGLIATAWEIAFLLPNMLRNLLAEGVLSQAFIPIYSAALGESEDKAKKTAGVILTFVFVFLSGLTAAGIAVFPYVLPAYAGTTGDEARLLVYLAQVMFAFIMTASLTAIFAGISQTHQHFTFPALSPIFLNIVLISGFLFLRPMNFDAEQNAMYLAWFVVAGGIFQLILQIIYTIVKGWMPELSMAWRDPALRRIFSLMAPAVIGASIFQFNQLIDIAIAGYMIPEHIGAVPGLRFAHRLIQLPTGIIGVALSTAILPALVELIRKKEIHENQSELAKALSFSFFLTVPASLGLFFLGRQIIHLLFSGGEWDLQSTETTWLALKFYCLGVPLYSMVKILTSSFYAYQDTKTPVKIMAGVVILNLALNLALVPYLMHGGLALSTALCSFVNVSLLYRAIGKKMGSLSIKPLLLLIKAQLPAIIALFCYLYGLGLFLNSFDLELNRETAALHTALGVVGGGLVYLTIAYATRLEEIKVITSFLKRR